METPLEPSSELGRKLLADYILILPPDPMRPVYTCLSQAFVRRVVELADLASAGPAAEARPQVQQHYEELKELRDWLGVPLEPEQKRILPHLIKGLLEVSGWPSSEIREIVGPMEKPPRGRLPTKRRDAIAALELRIADSKSWSYGRLARKFCDGKLHDSGQIGHNFKCRDRMKALLKSVSSVRRKYCPEVHSDEAT